MLWLMTISVEVKAQKNNFDSYDQQFEFIEDSDIFNLRIKPTKTYVQP